jgi:hypothetical protein
MTKARFNSITTTDAIQQLVHKFILDQFGVARPDTDLTVKQLRKENLVFLVTTVIQGVQHQWIAKQTTAEEIVALAALKQAGIGNVPETLTQFTISNVPVILLPEYPGTLNDFGDALPGSILHCLASVHQHFRGLEIALPPTNRQSLESLFKSSLGNLDIYPSPAAREKLARVRDALDEFVRVAQSFSQTLVHWDVHPGNVLVNGDESVLIDWGNACVGPAMIDLANVVEWDSPDFRRYADSYEMRSGKPFDYESTLIEYEWSRAITQIKYLPYAAKLDKGKHVERLTDIAFEYATSFN